MMQTFSKQELAWIYKALKHEEENTIEAMEKAEKDSPWYNLCELNLNNIRETARKLNLARKEGCKRIAIK